MALEGEARLVMNTLTPFTINVECGCLLVGGGAVGCTAGVVASMVRKDIHDAQVAVVITPGVL